jgi:hypothetical protein
MLCWKRKDCILHCLPRDILLHVIFPLALRVLFRDEEHEQFCARRFIRLIEWDLYTLQNKYRTLDSESGIGIRFFSPYKFDDQAENVRRVKKIKI